MKKVTRLSLDELAKAMPVLTEDEQRACVGGTFYYADNGTYLGALGPGTEIRVTDADTFKLFTGFNNGTDARDDNADLYAASSGIGGSSASSKWNIINEIASGMGIGRVTTYSGPSKSLGKWDPFSGMQMNADSFIMDSGNYYDFYLTLMHEKQHRDTPHDVGTNQSEYEAYSATFYDENFQYASESFKEFIIRGYNKYKNLVNK